jgi:hypothetical protein
MISKAIGNILISNQGLVNAAEAKIKEAGKNKVQEEVLSKLPNPADLQNQLNGINVQNTEQLKKAEQTYKKLHNVCEVSISKLNSFKTQIKAIDKKLEIVNQLFNKAKEVIELVQPIIPILKFTIPVIANAAIAASTGPLASGAAIDRAQKARDAAKGKVDEFEGIINLFTSISRGIISKTESLINITKPALTNLNSTILLVQNRCNQIDFIYKTFLEQQNFIDNQILEDAGTNVIDSPSTGGLGDILANLPNSNSQKVFEELGQTPKTGYRYRNISSSNTL